MTGMVCVLDPYRNLTSVVSTAELNSSIKFFLQACDFHREATERGMDAMQYLRYKLAHEGDGR